MVAWAVKNMGGMIPRTDSRNLADNMAEQAINCDLSSGAVAGLPQPEFIIKLAVGANPAKRGYRFPSADGTSQVWLPLPSPYSSVARSPLANDTNHRIYWTNPGDSIPWWNTYANIQGGIPPYNLGIVQPSTAIALGVFATGGVSTIILARSYCYTWVNQFGEESAPNLPSVIASGNSDAVWTITGMPTAPPANPPGVNYPTVTGLNLYRTVTGTLTGAQFFLVASFNYGSNPPPASYADTTADSAIINNLTLPSSGWGNPPANLDGLTALPGGMLVGWTGNTVHFCEPNRPHSWPAAYDQSLQYSIVGFGVWQQSLVVMTSGFPFTGSGNSPANFGFIQVRVPEPCIARGSIITDLMGVYYASQNGLVMLNYFGMQNQTLSTVTKNIWLNTFKATSIIACRHRAQYLAINGTGSGFLIDYSEQRLGFMNLSTFANVVTVWNDEYTGDAYMCDTSGNIYRWDSPVTAPLTYRWRSKQFYGPAPVSLGACQISLDVAVESTLPAYSPLLDNGDPTLALPAGVNAQFKLYAGSAGPVLVYTKNLTKARMIFRLPSGFKAFDWQFEIVSRVTIKSVELGTTAKELKGV